VAFSHGQIDLDAHCVLLGWRFDGGTRLYFGRSDQDCPRRDEPPTPSVGSPRY